MMMEMKRCVVLSVCHPSLNNAADMLPQGEEEVQPMLPPEFEGHEAIEAAENGEEEGEQE
jgi:hypothetical protein